MTAKSNRWTLIIKNGEIQICSNADHIEVAIDMNHIIMNVYDCSKEKAIQTALEFYGKSSRPS